MIAQSTILIAFGIILSLAMIDLVHPFTSSSSLMLPRIIHTGGDVTLFATKKKPTNKKKKSTGGGFGGASMEPCPCGSDLTYSGCCGKIHKDVTAFKTATAGQIVRARYSAYAKKQVCVKRIA